MRTKLTEAQRHAILREYKAGLPTLEIATRFGVDPSYPTLLAGRRGVPRRIDGDVRTRMAEAAGQRSDPRPR